MLGTDLREIRRLLRLDRLAFARLLGYTGTDRNDIMRVRKYENNRQQIPLYIARAAWMLAVWFRRTGELPPFPDWQGYNFEHSADPGHHRIETDDGVLA
jgi:transcriptional regulator with XRE-family HTH domain